MTDDSKIEGGRYEYFLLNSTLPVRVIYGRNGYKVGAEIPDEESGALVKRATYLSVLETSPDVEKITQEEFERRCAQILQKSA